MDTMAAGVFFMVTSMERVCHIDDFCARNKEPSCLREGQKVLKAMMHFPPSLTLPILHPSTHPAEFQLKKEPGHPHLSVFIVLEEMIIQTQIRR